MPNVAVYNDKVIHTEDIFKFKIDKSSDFKCFTCEGVLQFRQKRTADKNYTDHFYHPNTEKDTHIECEKINIEAIRENSDWHNGLSNFIKEDSREIIRKTEFVKHIADCFDAESGCGVEFQHSPISVEEVQSRDRTTELDWIFDCSNQYIAKVEIGEFIICEIPNSSWERAVPATKNNVFLYTGNKEWIYLENKGPYRIEVDDKKRTVWIGQEFSFEEILENVHSLNNAMTEEGKAYYKSIVKASPVIKNVFARCKESMFLLDDIHRKYINEHKFKNGDIIGVKSVAGSGKTTTLLNLAKLHKNKRILYLAFNSILSDEIKSKIKKEGINNMTACTYDSLLYGMFTGRSGGNYFDIIKNFKPQNLNDIDPWFRDKAFKMKKFYTDHFNDFCAKPEYTEMEEYCMNELGKEHKVLNNLWAKAKRGVFTTYEVIRKRAYIEKWFKDYIDKTFDIIMVDEVQDFDETMLLMLLDDTTLPKIFVGDPRQSIYEWRGSINAFEYLPYNALILEFYSTFRVGDPACESIRERFNDCWMISKSTNKTIISTACFTDKYTYLFRTWKTLLNFASKNSNIWINNYNKHKETILKLHEVVKKRSSDDDEPSPDDLPNYLRSLSRWELDNLMEAIENNLADKKSAQIKIYTIHSYKGMEDDNIRIANDMTIEDEKIYYVAITRARNQILIDAEKFDGEGCECEKCIKIENEKRELIEKQRQITEANEIVRQRLLKERKDKEEELTKNNYRVGIKNVKVKQIIIDKSMEAKRNFIKLFSSK